LAVKDPDGLQHVSSSFENMGAHLLAAEAAADAAVAWTRIDSRRHAEASAHRAEAQMSLCKGATTPALLTLETRVRLTPAERHAAVMAAAGRSNKAIAEVVGLSVRTVESQLQRVYRKLNITGRAQLREAFKHADQG
jgi:DNA-binding CsgD family transcriptional regulator